MRALTIPADNEWGYPELTAERQAKIFGLNSARVYGVDPKERHCQIDSCQITQWKRQLDDELGERRWVFDEPDGIRTYDEYVENGRDMIKRGYPG